MADTITSNYHWVKPEISGSPTTWGVKINADLDLIDSQLFTTTATANAAKALADNIVIGEIKMFAGVTPPTNWLLCDGAVYNNSDIPLLAPILNNAFGGVFGTSNAVPDLRSRFPIGYQAGGTLPIGTMGGEATHTLSEAEMPSHDHDLASFVTDPGHLHDVTDPHHNHSGVARFTATTGPTGGTSPGLAEGYSDSSFTGISIQTATTGITVASYASNRGGDGSHNNLPPFCGVNFIIKFQ